MESITYRKEPTLSKFQHQKKKNPLRLPSSKLTLYSILSLLLLGQYLFAQEKAQDSIKTWHKEGKIAVLVNQYSFNNWLAGGTTNFSGTMNFDYKIVYKNEAWLWTSITDIALGFAKIDSEEFVKKTEDRLEINSQLERKSLKPWKWSSSFNLKTQNTPGYTFVANENNSIERIKSTGFFSPAYLRLGFGASYKKSEAFAFQFEPLTARVIIVDQIFTQSIGPEERYFGVKQGETTRWEAGVSLAMQSKVELLKNVFFSNKISLFSNYLEDIKNVDLDYTGTHNIKVNDYLSAMIELQLVYDDNALKDLQLRQVFGIAIGFPF